MFQKRTKFMSFLAVVSIIGFSATAASVLMDLNIAVWANSLIFMALGIGLLVEGNVRTFIGVRKKGYISVDETTHILALVIGLISLIAGFLSLPIINVTAPAFESVKGWLSIFAIVIITAEAWLVK